jgi:hypothetical protein
MGANGDVRLVGVMAKVAGLFRQLRPAQVQFQAFLRGPDGA